MFGVVKSFVKIRKFVLHKAECVSRLGMRIQHLIILIQIEVYESWIYITIYNIMTSNSTFYQVHLVLKCLHLLWNALIVNLIMQYACVFENNFSGGSLSAGVITLVGTAHQLAVHICSVTMVNKSLITEQGHHYE